MARRSYSDETKTAAVEALRDGEEISEVAARFDIPRRTVQGWWRWQEKYELSPRHRAFVDAYFRLNMNGTRAYMEVYGVDEKTAAVNASRLLRNAKVGQVIDERLQRLAMGADEVLARLGQMARGDLAHYITEDGHFDLDQMREEGLGHLLKKHKIKRTVRYAGDDETETEWREVELYDAQAALNKLLDHLTKGPSGASDDPIHTINYIVENRPEDDDDSASD